MTEYIINTLVFLFYIQSFHMTEYFSPERALSVRLYVCVCMCVCHSLLFEHYSADFDETCTI